jgi:cyclase
MARTRIIPCLLISDSSLVKTKQFKNPIYIGDPLNTAKIFNEKEVDELIILDIDATVKGKDPNYNLISEIAGECSMPVAYGGGIRNLDQARKLIRCGIEKVVINSASLERLELIQEIAEVFGSQSVVGSIDVLSNASGEYCVATRSGTKKIKLRPEEHASSLVSVGVGEIFLNSIDRDGMMEGYDLTLIRKVAENINVPLIVCGGAGTVDHLQQAILKGGASAVAAGSMFVFYGKNKAVLINYPTNLIIN